MTTAHSASAHSAKDRSITITRVISAPRELVWRAMTEPEHLVHWWGPNGFTNTFYEFEMKPGGVWRFMMHGPDGTDYPNKIVFTEIVAPERIEFDHSGDGDTIETDHRFHSTITMEEEGDATKVTLHSIFETEKDYEFAAKFGAIEGGMQTLGRLADHVSTMQ